MEKDLNTRQQIYEQRRKTVNEDHTKYLNLNELAIGSNEQQLRNVSSDKNDNEH